MKIPLDSGATVQAPRERKRLLRQALLAGRKALPKEALCGVGRAVCSQIAALPAFAEASAVLLYYPTEGELDLLPLAALAEARGVPVGFPVCQTETKTLIFRRADQKTVFQPDAYGIPAPPESAEQLTFDKRALCLIPALGFDENLYRIGRGGGYYDRFLATFSGIKAGVCAARFLVPSVFPEPHDIPVDLLITELRIFKGK